MDAMKRRLLNRLRKVIGEFKLPIVVTPMKRWRALAYTDDHLYAVEVELFIKLTFISDPNHGVMVGVMGGGVPVVVYNYANEPPHCASPHPIKRDKVKVYSECHIGDWAVVAVPFSLMLQRVKILAPSVQVSCPVKDGKVYIASGNLVLATLDGNIVISPAEWFSFYSRLVSKVLYETM